MFEQICLILNILIFQLGISIISSFKTATNFECPYKLQTYKKMYKHMSINYKYNQLDTTDPFS